MLRRHAACRGTCLPPLPCLTSPACCSLATLPCPGAGRTAGTDTSRIPATAIPALGLETSMAWKSDHDEQTRGRVHGQLALSHLSRWQEGPPGRQFVASYGNGGERYHLIFGRDTNATHFVYEANVYLVDPAEIANVEMDMNQVLCRRPDRYLRNAVQLSFQDLGVYLREQHRHALASIEYSVQSARLGHQEVAQDPDRLASR